MFFTKMSKMSKNPLRGLNMGIEFATAVTCVVLWALLVFYVVLVGIYLVSSFEGFSVTPNTPPPEATTPPPPGSFADVIKDHYQPLQVTCTKSDCDYIQDLITNDSVNLDPSANNYYNDGKRQCNFETCDRIDLYTRTMTSLDDKGAYFRDPSGVVWSYQGQQMKGW